MAKATPARREPARTATLTDEQILERLAALRPRLASVQEETARLLVEVAELERELKAPS